MNLEDNLGRVPAMEWTGPERRPSSPPPQDEAPGEDLGPEVTCVGGTAMGAIVDQEVIHAPPLLSWPQWQIWRRDFGFRPREPAGLRSAFRQREGALHRQLMAHFHGDTWRDQLFEIEYAQYQQEPAHQGAEEPAGEVGPRGLTLPSTAQLALQTAAYPRLEPTLVPDPDGVEAVMTETHAIGAQAVPSTARGTSSEELEAGSWAGLTVAELRRRALEDIDLLVETLEDYTKRVFRAVALLDGQNVQISADILRGVVMKARRQKALEHLDGEASLDYLRARLREVMQPGVSEAGLRQTVLLMLLLEHTADPGLKDVPVVSLASDEAEDRTSSVLTREALLNAAQVGGLGGRGSDVGDPGGLDRERPPGLFGAGVRRGPGPRERGSRARSPEVQRRGHGPELFGSAQPNTGQAEEESRQRSMGA